MPCNWSRRRDWIASLDAPLFAYHQLRDAWQRDIRRRVGAVAANRVWLPYSTTRTTPLAANAISILGLSPSD